MPMWRPSPDWLQMLSRMFRWRSLILPWRDAAMLWRTVRTLSTREDTETKQRFTVEEGSQWSQAISVSNCRRFRSRAGILQRRRAIDADDVQCQLLFIFSGCACQVPISTLWSLPHRYYYLCASAQRSAELGLDLAHLSKDPVEEEDGRTKMDKRTTDQMFPRMAGGCVLTKSNDDLVVE